MEAGLMTSKGSSNERLSTCSEEEFRQLFEKYGATETARRLKITERAVYRRRKTLGEHRPIFGPSQSHLQKEYPHRATFSISDGYIIVGSDLHIWPGPASTALRAFKKFCKDLKPKLVVLNGDVMDFPSISRHSPIMWESAPLPVDELEAAQDHLDDIVKAAGKAEKIWTLGNHDARFEAFVAARIPQLQRIRGFHLQDHFGLWRWAWSVWVNNEVVIKHRYKGGIHATHNNAVYSGKHMITGHLHSQKVTPFTDYNGTRYGVDTGCVADTNHTAFVNYTEDNAKNWISGFGVLKFIKGRLLYPQLVSVWDDDHVQFNGEIIKV